ncbi:MAG: ABC transporter permease subunit, partial [Janthinobacterium lividum]
MNDGLVTYLPLMAKAAGTSIWLSWLGLLLGIVVGAGIALLRRSRTAPLRWLALIYTEFWRSIPILIVMFFAYYGAPLLLGFDLSPFTAATLALALHASASMAEIIRAALA